MADAAQTKPSHKWTEQGYKHGVRWCHCNICGAKKAIELFCPTKYYTEGGAYTWSPNTLVNGKPRAQYKPEEIEPICGHNVHRHPRASR